MGEQSCGEDLQYQHGSCGRRKPARRRRGVACAVSMPSAVVVPSSRAVHANCGIRSSLLTPGSDLHPRRFGQHVEAKVRRRCGDRGGAAFDPENRPAGGVPGRHGPPAQPDPLLGMAVAASQVAVSTWLAWFAPHTVPIATTTSSCPARCTAPPARRSRPR